MSIQAERVEGFTQKKAGRPEIYVHKTNHRFVKDTLPTVAEVEQMIMLNRLESEAEFFFNLGRVLASLPEAARDKVLARMYEQSYYWYELGVHGGDFEILYNQKKREEI